MLAFFGFCRLYLRLLGVYVRRPCVFGLYAFCRCGFHRRGSGTGGFGFGLRRLILRLGRPHLLSGLRKGPARSLQRRGGLVVPLLRFLGAFAELRQLGLRLSEPGRGPFGPVFFVTDGLSALGQILGMGRLRRDRQHRRPHRDESAGHEHCQASRWLRHAFLLSDMPNIREQSLCVVDCSPEDAYPGIGLTHTIQAIMFLLTGRLLPIIPKKPAETGIPRD
ncbi:hypothetical protein [Actinocorallia populi]|uniref:hypothetical protein n=1 Tax=Actinocorallia populi TaxID=2079200 RepID=UPI0013003727|nr:hypothetical protein [Actinocorallia populi]